MNHSFIFSSNPLRLSWREWAAVFALLLLALFGAPRVWRRAEEFNPCPDYRLPYRYSEDYWLFVRWCDYARKNYDVLVVGDSVVWGHYVAMDGTLSHYLTEFSGGRRFANSGVDGVHPVALAGLIKYHGRAIAGKRVLLHLNPLWMSSKRRDLQTAEKVRFNHPRLVPQFLDAPPCYAASLATRIGAVLERSLSFFRLVKHIRSIYFDNMDIGNWTMENPYRNPFSGKELKAPTPENKPQSRPVSWSKRGMRKEDFPWLPPEESYQWKYFLRTVKILRRRGNRVFVVIGPFNPYILTEESLKRYKETRRRMESQLRASGVEFLSVPALPSELYADASHPLADGYALIARRLLESKSFVSWLERN